jgi:3D (Asp-Asp-Asp) domain-containing protein
MTRTLSILLLPVTLAMLVMMSVGAERPAPPSRDRGVVGSPALGTTERPVTGLAVASLSSSELMQDDAAPALSSSSSTMSASVSRTMWMEVTAYCPCTRCCGPRAQGITASGHPVTHNAGRFVAADTSVLPFGTRVSIPGYHDATPVPVLDRGGAIKGAKLDLYFPTHDQALQWGRQWVMVTVSE